MHALDRKIREALTADEAEVLGPLEEPSLWKQFTELFQGRLRWVNVLVLIGTLAAFVFTIITIMYFFRAEGVREMIAWAGGFGLGLISITAGRIWLWMILHRNALLREIKRVELQIARLASQLNRTR
jgi:hypothetical protein